MIEDNYFKAVPTSDARQRLDRRHGPRAAAALRRPLLPLLHPNDVDQLRAGDLRPVLGVGLTRERGAPRACGWRGVLPDTPAEQAGIKRGDVITEVDGKSIAGHLLGGLDRRGSRARRARRSRSRVESRPTAGSPSELTRRARQRPGPGGRRATMRRARTARRSPTSRFAHLQRTAPTASCATTIKASTERGAEGLVLDLRGNGGGLLNEAVLSASIFLEEGADGRLHQEPHPGRHATTTRSATRCHAASDRRADQPRHRLGGRDPHRGARRSRPRDGRRHPLLRQGRLPGGDPPARRRRARPDDRRVLHGRRRVARRQGHQARRPRRATTPDTKRTRGSSAASPCSAPSFRPASEPAATSLVSGRRRRGGRAPRPLRRWRAAVRTGAPRRRSLRGAGRGRSRARWRWSSSGATGPAPLRRLGSPRRARGRRRGAALGRGARARLRRRLEDEAREAAAARPGAAGASAAT